MADNAEGAIRRAAHSIYWHAINQPQVLNRTPEWSRFRTSEGFESYQVGKAKHEKGSAAATEAAIDDYQKAANCEVFNALIRLSLGAALGTENAFLELMKVYSHVVTRWPEMVEPRYRLAVTFSYHKKIRKDLNKMGTEQKQVLLELLRDYVKQDASTQSKQALDGIGKLRGCQIS